MAFLPLPEALERSAQEKRPVLAFFYSPDVLASRRAWDQTLNTPAFRDLTAGCILASTDDVSGPGASWSYRYYSFQVPSFLFLSPDGQIMRKSLTGNSVQDVRTMFAP